MIVEQVNPIQIVLELAISNPDGTEKTNVTSATARVFHIASGVEVNDLGVTSMVQVGVTNIWRYVWSPATLVAGNYTAQYIFADSDALTGNAEEDIVIGYLESNITALQSDITTIKNIETGRWRILNDQLILFGPDNNTEIARFNLFDSEGKPSSDTVFDRQKV